MTVLTLRAAVAPSSLDVENRTFEAIASTGADVRRSGYVERLALEGAELPDTVPVLDSHRQDGLDRVLGVVTAWRREAGRLIAQVRLSERASAILSDIAGGIIRGVSLGYQVEAWRDSRGADGTPVRTAVKWKVHELSLVAVPADPGAIVRSKEDPMPDIIEAEPDAINRAQVNQEIRTIASLAHLTRAWADELIDRAATVDEARAAAFAAMAKAQPSIRAASVGWSSDDPAVRTRAMGDALFANLANKAPEGVAQNFSHIRGFHDLARELIGGRVTSYGVADLVQRAMATGDFPVVLGNVVGRFVRQAYESVQPGILAVAQDRLVPDFREQRFVAIHGPGLLTVKEESGEYAEGSLDEKYEKASVVTYAAGLSFTRETIINDDRGAFANVPQRLGIAARNTEIAAAVSLLTSGSGVGPVLVDGKALFHADHGNLAGTAGALSVDTLSAGRTAMRTMKDSKNNPINVTPAALVVPASKETSAQQLLATIQPAAAGDVNPFAGALQLVVEPRLTGTRWYLVAGNVEGLIMLRLEGRAGPQVETEIDFSTKNVKFSVLNDFAPAFVDHRSWYSNAGA